MKKEEVEPIESLIEEKINIMRELEGNDRDMPDTKLYDKIKKQLICDHIFFTIDEDEDFVKGQCEKCDYQETFDKEWEK